LSLLIIISGLFFLDYFSLLPVKLPFDVNKEIKNPVEIIGSKNSTETNKINDDLNLNYIQICIRGSVKKPGLVKIIEKGRVADAIIAAGGLKSDAYDKELNLAEVLEDGAFIYIMSKNEYRESIENDSSTSINGNSVSKNSLGNNTLSKGKININRATLSELDSLPGIGPATAEKIISYRNINKKFNKIEELSKVSGIGDAKFSALKGLISVK